MADHLVDVVDDQDVVIGQDLKSNKLSKNFISRIVAIMLFDSKNNMILCRRADHKINAAGKYDLAACGNVEAGESYDQAAKREFKEETNLDCKLELLDKFYQTTEYSDKSYRIFCAVYRAISDEPLSLNHELVEVKKIKIDDLVKDLEENPQNYCPGFVNDFKQVKDKIISDFC